jgi:hypothetical protein
MLELLFELLDLVGSIASRLGFFGVLIVLVAVLGLVAWLAVVIAT